MSFKHTNRILLSTPMGISIGIHALLAAGIIFLSWERPEQKLEIPPIKITHIKLEKKKPATPKKTIKPVKGDPKSLKVSQPFKPTLQQTRTILRKISIPVKPIIPIVHNINNIAQKQPTTMFSSSVEAFPISVRRSQNPHLINFSSTQSASIHTTQQALIISAHSARPNLPSKNTLGKSLIRVAATNSKFSKGMYSSPALNNEASAITDVLNSTPLKSFPVPGLQIAERRIPVSKANPVQIASITTDFVDKNSKNTSLASATENPGHFSRKTMPSDHDLNDIRKGFSSSVWGKIAQAKYYPSLARKRGWEGKPIVEFKLGRNGDLISSAITITSPHKILNDAALDAIKNAAPYPEIPKILKMNSIRFRLPIYFIIDG